MDEVILRTKSAVSRFGEKAKPAEVATFLSPRTREREGRHFVSCIDKDLPGLSLLLFISLRQAGSNVRPEAVAVLLEKRQ